MNGDNDQVILIFLLSFDTNKIVTPRPGEVHTWPLPRALEWVLVSQALSKDSQGI